MQMLFNPLHSFPHDRALDYYKLIPRPLAQKKLAPGLWILKYDKKNVY